MSTKTTGTIVTTPAHSSFRQVGFFLKIRRLKKMIWTVYLIVVRLVRSGIALTQGSQLQLDHVRRPCIALLIVRSEKKKKKVKQNVVIF